MWRGCTWRHVLCTRVAISRRERAESMSYNESLQQVPGLPEAAEGGLLSNDGWLSEPTRLIILHNDKSLPAPDICWRWQFTFRRPQSSLRVMHSSRHVEQVVGSSGYSICQLSDLHAGPIYGTEKLRCNVVQHMAFRTVCAAALRILCRHCSPCIC